MCIYIYIYVYNQPLHKSPNDRIPRVSVLGPQGVLYLELADGRGWAWTSLSVIVAGTFGLGDNWWLLP